MCFLYWAKGPVCLIWVYQTQHVIAKGEKAAENWGGSSERSIGQLTATRWTVVKICSTSTAEFIEGGSIRGLATVAGASLCTANNTPVSFGIITNPPCLSGCVSIQKTTRYFRLGLNCDLHDQMSCQDKEKHLLVQDVIWHSSYTLFKLRCVNFLRKPGIQGGPSDSAFRIQGTVRRASLKYGQHAHKTCARWQPTRSRTFALCVFL